MPNKPSLHQSLDHFLLAGFAFLWAQLYLTVTPVWFHGEYYDYAWFVPPIAAFFFFRHWQQRPGLEKSQISGAELLLFALILGPVLFGVRAIEGFDPSWRPPMLFHSLLLTLLTHWLLWRRGGRRFSLTAIPVTIFALSAIPSPFGVEQKVIAFLTDWVVQTSGFLFYFIGRPVQVYGSIVEWNGIKVQVTEGCSGIQSLQSLIMVSLYLGEFFRMRIFHRFILPLIAVVVAITINVGRAMYLARVRFEEGEAAFEAAHDGIGLIAFAVGGITLLLIARFLINFSDRRRKTRRAYHTSP